MDAGQLEILRLQVKCHLPRSHCPGVSPFLAKLRQEKFSCKYAEAGGGFSEEKEFFVVGCVKGWLERLRAAALARMCEERVPGGAVGVAWHRGRD